MGGILKFLPLPQKNYVGATKNNTGGRLKIRGDWEKFKYTGHTKFLGGLKNRGGKAFRGPVTEGCDFQPNQGWIGTRNFVVPCLSQHLF